MMRSDRSVRIQPHHLRYLSGGFPGFRNSHAAVVRILIMAMLLAPISPLVGYADTVTMKNGTQYRGDLGAIRAIDEGAGDVPFGADGVESVVFVDDGLRRTYVPRNQLALNPNPGNLVVYERIKVEQRVYSGSRGMGEIGQMSYVSPFSEYGRRFLVVNSERGPIEIHQGITEITPHYCVVEGLQSARYEVRWKLRIATSSIPRDTLSKIIYRQIDPTNPNERLKVVMLYQQAERHRDAIDELESIIADFPELTDIGDSIDLLRSAYANRIITELKLRFASGQFNLAYGMIENFPTDNIASEVLGEVRVLGQNHLNQTDLVESLATSFQELVTTTKASIELDDDQVASLDQIAAEIDRDLNLNNLARMADFRRLMDDSSKTPDQIVSLAITGWLLGSGQGDTNLAVALAQVQVRDLVFEYLSTANAARRQEILAELEQLEGSLPDSLAKIVANLLPVKPMPQVNEGDIPGMFRIQIPGVDAEHQIEYLVQLPPEYDPYRRYPCIVTLGDGTTPEQQIDWWAGPHSERDGMRMGQAARHGYIVISPYWRNPDEVVYRYSVREHASVLFSLQDAMRRFSIDTERVFLSGHSQGGTAAWDIGLAHPDIWAGVIPIVATAGKYIERYWKNGRNNSAFYFVHGEFDHRRMLANAKD